MLRLKATFTHLIFFWLILFILRVPSFFFSWWYEDENIYLAIGHAIVKGKLLYVQTWDNKPPLIYLIYAVLYIFFETQIWAYKVFNFLLAVWEISIFNYIVSDIFSFSKKQTFWTTLSLTVLLGIAFEGTILNAENIFVPLVLTGFYLIYSELKVFQTTEKINIGRLLFGGIFWFLASFTKIHAVLEIGILSLVSGLILIYDKFHTVTSLRILVSKLLKFKQLKYFILIPLLPTFIGYICLILFYNSQGYLPDLYYSLVGFSKDYVQTNNIPIILGFKLTKLTGLQIRTVLFCIILIVVTYLFWKNYIKKSSFLLCSWLSVTGFIVLIPERGYNHYLLQLLPPALISVTLLANYLSLSQKSIIEKFLLLISVGLGSQMLLSNFPTTYKTLWNYYDNVGVYFGQFVKVTLNKKSLKAWQKSYDPLIYEAQELLPSKVQELTTPKDKIFLYGKLSEIYAMSDRVSGAKWITAAHVVDNKKLYQKLLASKTRLIVIDSNMDNNKKFSNLISSNYKKILSVEQYDFWSNQ